jgi:hypothetical protein
LQYPSTPSEVLYCPDNALAIGLIGKPAELEPAIYSTGKVPCVSKAQSAKEMRLNSMASVLSDLIAVLELALENHALIRVTGD